MGYPEQVRFVIQNAQNKFGNLLVLTWGTWIGLAWLTLAFSAASYTSWEFWLTTLIVIPLFVASTFSLIRNGRKEASRGMRWSRLSICFVIASFTVAGPFLGIALGIVTDSVLSWYWLVCVGGGFLLSLAGLKSLSIILPGEIARIRLPAWNRYCDAVKQQAKARLKPRSR